jgi:5-methylcytosine-specific restriction endonuclease McrA
MTTKKEIRQQFRDAVFKRDGHKCRVCGAVGELDAHHITDRHDMPNGGYVRENGISLCETCHALAEVWHATGQEHFEIGYHPDNLYELIGSSWKEAWEAADATASPT